MRKSAKNNEDDALFFIAKQYFKSAHEIMKKHDPNHLLLGTRFLSILTPKSVLKACADYVDAVSVNHFQFMFRMDIITPYLSGTAKTVNCLEEFHQITNKPILITEFGYRVKKKGQKRYLPVGFSTFSSDKKRGKQAFNFIQKAINSKHTIGWHLFQWFDQPPNGRFDYQNSHFGLVNVENEIYEEYARYLEQANKITF